MGYYKQGEYIIYQSHKRFVSRELIPALKYSPALNLKHDAIFRLHERNPIVTYNRFLQTLNYTKQKRFRLTAE